LQPAKCPLVAAARHQTEDVLADPQDVGRVEDRLVVVEHHTVVRPDVLGSCGLGAEMQFAPLSK
jgi:hypothetical protein